MVTNPVFKKIELKRDANIETKNPTTPPKLEIMEYVPKANNILNWGPIPSDSGAFIQYAVMTAAERCPKPLWLSALEKPSK